MSNHNQQRRPPVVVDAPLDGRRRVTIHGNDVGAAITADELRRMLHRAGLAEHHTSLDDPDLIEWRGGGPDVWPAA
jgi:hypothetical protein